MEGRKQRVEGEGGEGGGEGEGVGEGGGEGVGDDEGGGEEGGSRVKQSSCSQEHLLALRKESEGSLLANRSLTKSPSTGLTKYLTGAVPFFPGPSIFCLGPTRPRSEFSFFRELRKAGVESHTDGLSSNIIWGQICISPISGWSGCPHIPHMLASLLCPCSRHSPGRHRTRCSRDMPPILS